MADNLNNNSNYQLITGIITIILHDLHLICSFIISYPLYFSYGVFFFPYVIKLISFISPLFIVTVFLSLLITTTTTAFCPNLKQLKLGIVKIVVQELKLDLDEVIGDEGDCDFEEFEIYKIVFDCDLLIMICDQSDELGFEKFLEHSVCGGRRSEVADSDSDVKKLDVEKRPESPVHDGRKSDVTTSSSDVVKLGPAQSRRKNDMASIYSDVDKFGSVHGCRKNDLATSDSYVKKLCIENFLETSFHDCRKNDVATSDSDVKKLGFKKFLVTPVHGDRKIDVATSNSDVNELDSFLGSQKTYVASCVLNMTKLGSVHGERKNDVASYNSDMNKSGTEKLIEELSKFEEFSPEIKSPVKKAGNGSETTSSIYHEKPSENLVRSNSSSIVTKVGNGSETINSIYHDKSNENLVRSSSSSTVTSYGSMREEKEWRKTLACKLFEERHNSVGGEEGMDSLWESHENDNSKYRKGVMTKNKNNGASIRFDTDIGTDTGTGTDTDNDEVVMSNGHLCCLQALRLSTRKMNLGMGKPNMVKISKAFKGFGWLNYVKNKHGKKS